MAYRSSTTESAPVRWLLIGLAFIALTLFLLLPLAAVFIEAFRRGADVLVKSLSEDAALSAVKLTLLAALVAVPLNTMKTQKKMKRFDISIPRKLGILAPASAGDSPAPGGINALSVPANLFATAFAKNHVPIIKDERRIGANLLTMLNPIGDKQSSPIVCTMYNANNQNMAIFVDGSTP